jgi:hypothetical protein
VKPGQDIDEADAEADENPADEVGFYTEGKHVLSLVP